MNRGDRIVITKSFEFGGTYYPAGETFPIAEVVWKDVQVPDYRTAKKEEKIKGKAIYINLNNGWNKLLYKDQYIWIEEMELQIQEGIIKQAKRGEFL